MDQNLAKVFVRLEANSKITPQPSLVSCTYGLVIAVVRIYGSNEF